MKLKNNIIKLVTIIVLIIGCNNMKRFEMIDMVGNNNLIDVTDLVENKYKPIYNKNNEICALVNTCPNKININFEKQIKTELKKYLKEKNISLEIDKEVLYSKSEYQYSYIISKRLIDVYKLKIKNVEVYFRIDENIIIPSFNEEGWVFW